MGDILEDIAAAGDNVYPYSIGVYANRGLVYEQLESAPKYIRRGNQIVNFSGMPVPPHHIRPGYMLIEDEPMLSEYLRSGDVNDTRYFLIDEVEFAAPKSLHFTRDRLDFVPLYEAGGEAAAAG